jgi:hypothetical protein
MRFPLQRLLAVALPVSFLWLFAACVLICEREVADTHDRPIVSSPGEAVEAEGTTDCGECPVNSLPEATAPERTALKFNLQTPSGVPPSLHPTTSLTGGLPPGPPERRPPSADPPLARLPALRI